MNGTARLQLPKKNNNKKQNIKSETNIENEVEAINYPRSHVSLSVCKLDFAVVRVEKKEAHKKWQHTAASGAARRRRSFPLHGEETCTSRNLQPLDAPLVNHGFRPVREARTGQAQGDS